MALTLQQQAQVQEEQEISPIRHLNNHSKQQKRAKYHRSLENTDSGFTKQGNVYFTQADGSIEIDGDLQFMSDPNITISNFTQDEETSSAIQIFGTPSATNTNVVLQQVIFCCFLLLFSYNSQAQVCKLILQTGKLDS